LDRGSEWAKNNMKNWMNNWIEHLKEVGFPEQRIKILTSIMDEYIDAWLDYRLALILENSAEGLTVKEYDGEKYISGADVLSRLTESFKLPLNISVYGSFEYRDENLKQTIINLKKVVDDFFNVAFKKYRMIEDNFLSKAKEYVDLMMKKEDTLQLNLRVDKPVSFRGANKIVAAIVIDDKKKPAHVYVRYKGDEDALQRLIDEYAKKWGGDIDVVDQTGEVVREIRPYEQVAS